MPISLYRQWRPQKFADVVNQTPVIKTLEGALLKNRLVHAYLFAGPRGTGKTTVARLLAKAINCFNRKGFEPCNKCESCRAISQNHSLDLFEIDAASHRGIDEIKDLIEKIKFTPTSSKHKVFIIDEVHMLTREAFNALLKTLEEPPAHAIFILATTEAHKVPPTILSRCQRFDFQRIATHEIEKRLEKIAKAEKIKIEPKGAELIAKNSEGSLRDAISFLEQLRALTDNKITLADIEYIFGLTSLKSVLKFLELIIQNEPKKAIELANQLFESGYELSQFMKNLVEEVRKIILVKTGIETKDLNLEEEEEKKIIAWSESLNLKTLMRMIKIFEGATEMLKTIFMPQLALEMAVLELTTPDEIQKEVVIKDIKPLTKPVLVERIAPEIQTRPEKKVAVSKINPKSVAEIIKIWPRICEEVKSENSSLSAFLCHCVPLEIKDGKIILSTRFKLYADKVKEKSNIIEAAIKKHLKKNLLIECQTVNNQNKEIYRQNLERLKEAQKDIEENLIKDAMEIFKE